MFKDAIKALMELIIEDIKNLSLDSGLLASITRDNAYATIWSHVTSIASGAFRTCAFIVLLIFIMIEFLELSDRFSSNQLPDLLKPFSILIIKLALSITIINQSTTILNTIYNGFLDLSTQVNVTSSITMTTDLTNFNNSVDDMAFGVQIVALLVLFLCVLGTKIAWAFTQILTIGRFIQLYIYIAVAPIPIATLPNREWSQVGKGFLKSFVAVCLQGVILVLILYFFPSIATSMVTDIIPANNGLNGIFSAVGSIIVLIGALIVALKGSKAFADKICGAM